MAIFRYSLFLLLIGLTAFAPAAEPVTQPDTAPATAPAAVTQSAVAREASYVAVAVARAKAELAMRDVQRLLGRGRLDISEMNDSIEAAHGAAAAAMERAQNEEQRKPELDRSSERIDLITQRSKEMAERWQRFRNVEQPAIANQLQSAADTLPELGRAIVALAALEQNWKDLSLELVIIQRGYDGLGARAAQARAQAQGALDQYAAQKRLWDSQAAELGAGGPTTRRNP